MKALSVSKDNLSYQTNSTLKQIVEDALHSSHQHSCQSSGCSDYYIDWSEMYTDYVDPGYEDYPDSGSDDE